jgi:hypothetical protein
MSKRPSLFTSRNPAASVRNCIRPTKGETPGKPRGQARPVDLSEAGSMEAASDDVFEHGKLDPNTRRGSNQSAFRKAQAEQDCINTDLMSCICTFFNRRRKKPQKTPACVTNWPPSLLICTVRRHYRQHGCNKTFGGIDCLLGLCGCDARGGAGFVIGSRLVIIGSS